MKRLLFLSMFLVCLLTGYGQGAKVKQATRLPLDSVAMQSSAKRHDVQVIDGSQNVQTRSGGQSSNPYAPLGGRQLQLPDRFNKGSVASIEKRLPEPQSVMIERQRPQSQLRSSIVQNPREATNTFFRETPQLKIPDPDVQIRIDSVETDNLNITNIKGTQLYRNTPIYGMHFTFHISDESERFMGYTVDTTYINTEEAKLSADDAVRIAESDLSQTTVIQTPNEQMKQIMNYEKPSVETIYYPTKTNVYNYTYRITIRPNFRDEWIYYIDASSGEVVDKYNNTRTDGPVTGTGIDCSGVSRTVQTYLENGVYYLVNTTKPMFNAADFSGILAVRDAKNDRQYHEQGIAGFVTNSSASWNNQDAISAMYHTTLIYDYFQNTFQRNSFDNKGATMNTVINVCDPDDYGRYDNAYWNGYCVSLGNGSGYFNSWAGSFDFTAHEYGHAVVQYTANLEYRNQSGAINEAYADIFGVMIDRSNWTMGETLVKDKRDYPTGYVRDMRNPHNGGTSIYDDCWQPAHVSEMYLGTQDNGGVHINNSIPAHTFYVYATATSKERAEQVYYRALTTYLTPSSKFIDLRKAVLQAARDLNYSGDVQTISNAFDKVGIVDDSGNNTQPPADLPVNPGESQMLICNTDPADGNSLYKVVQYRDLIPISTTKMSSTPSVTDDGKYAIFADDKNNIRIIDMTSGSETNLNTEGDNQSVAISRDGNRVAVISTYEDGSIWVLDRNSGTWKQFRLYNPTTGSGSSKAGGPRFADALEFDHTGENLIYDAYNVAGSSLGGRTLDYWDIGLINVWNNAGNTWGTGEIAKLFSDLQPGVSVFNPVFSKNSPYIIALDYYSTEDDENYTLGVNLSTGALQAMISNNVASYPSYSMDDNHIAFTTYNYYGNNQYEIGYFVLGDDKISCTGDPQVIITGAAYPVYYGTGTRILGSPPVAAFTADDRSGGAPLLVQFVDMSDANPSSWRWTFEGGSPSSSTQQHPTVVYKTPGTYAVTLVASNSYGSGETVIEDYINVGNDFKVGQRVAAESSDGMMYSFVYTGRPQEEIILADKATIFPNPATNYVWINSAQTDKALEVRLYDLTGKAIPVTSDSDQGKTRIDVSRLQKGVYILHVRLSDGAMQTHKLIKQ